MLEQKNNKIQTHYRKKMNMSKMEF